MPSSGSTTHTTSPASVARGVSSSPTTFEPGDAAGQHLDDDRFRRAVDAGDEVVRALLRPLVAIGARSRSQIRPGPLRGLHRRID